MTEQVIKQCKDLINSSTKESIMESIEAVAQAQVSNEIVIPDLVNLLRLVEILNNHITLNVDVLKNKCGDDE